MTISPHAAAAGSLDTAKHQAKAAEVLGVSVEHTRRFGNGDLADSAEHDEEWAHQDLRSPYVTDSRKTCHGSQHEGTQL